jgi:hypothetical protein
MTAGDEVVEERWRRWRQAAVRDLAWVLASPPLLAPSRQQLASGVRVRWLNSAWSERAFQASTDWLQALDRHPAPLLEALSRRRDPRLGSYFETLLAFWLAWPGNPLYRLVAHNLPVRARNLTLGELDFLVEDRLGGGLQHWEVAVKFYLGVAPGGALENWIGPGRQDRLDLKVRRLLDHQLTLPSRPEGSGLLRHLGLPTPAPVCLLKGRLFYPPGVSRTDWAPAAAEPGHLQGWWQAPVDFLARQDPALQWLVLPKANWLTEVDGAGVPIGDARYAADFIELQQQSVDNRPLAVVGLREGREVSRGFITPPGWPIPCNCSPPFP